MGRDGACRKSHRPFSRTKGSTDPTNTEHTHLTFGMFFFFGFHKYAHFAIHGYHVSFSAPPRGSRRLSRQIPQCVRVMLFTRRSLLFFSAKSINNVNGQTRQSGVRKTSILRLRAGLAMLRACGLHCCREKDDKSGYQRRNSLVRGRGRCLCDDICDSVVFCILQVRETRKEKGPRRHFKKCNWIYLGGMYIHM